MNTLKLLWVTNISAIQHMSTPASSVPSALVLAILARLSYEVRYAFLLYEAV